MAIFYALVFSCLSHAGIFPIFNQAGDQATLMMSALNGGDPDAQQLFRVLSANAGEEQGKWTKKSAFIDRDGVKAFSTICVFSKLVPGNGSCTVVLHAAKGMIIQRAEKTVSYLIEDSAEATRMAQLFFPEAGKDFFRSANGNFMMSLERDSQGQARRFELSYR